MFIIFISITVPLNELYSFDSLEPDNHENNDVKSPEDKSDPLNDPINSESDPINDPIKLNFDPINPEHDPLNDPINIGGQTSGQTGGQRFSETAEKILDYIRQNKFITRSDLSEKLKINPSAVQKHLENLKKSGVLKRVGGDFGGHWEIIDNSKWNNG